MNRKYRKTVIAGNWKMNQLVSGVKPFMEDSRRISPSPAAVTLCSAHRLS